MLDAALDGEYALVVDARSEREYLDDHLPGAVNLPVVVNNEYAEVGTVHRDDPHRAYLIGVSYALRNIAAAIDELVVRYPKNSRMLVYCFIKRPRQHTLARMEPLADGDVVPT